MNCIIIDIIIHYPRGSGGGGVAVGVDDLKYLVPCMFFCMYNYEQCYTNAQHSVRHETAWFLLHHAQ